MNAGGRSVIPSEIRERYATLFRPRAAIYWGDLVGSASVGWACFGLALCRPHWPLWCALTLVSAVALWRAAYFIHELAHLKPGALPGFELGWHVLVGIPLLLPSLMIDEHRLHHAKSTYGTQRDPEYAFVPLWSPTKQVMSVLVLALVPFALAVRWGLLGPLGWFVRPLSKLLVEHASTLQTNPDFRRAPPRPEAQTRWFLQELAAALFVWSVCIASFFGLSLFVISQWWVVASVALMLNQVRTLVAHAYAGDGSQLSFEEQVLDSTTVGGIRALNAWMLPVGTRYHALHHLLPSLPYHSLGELHRALVRELAPDHVYLQKESRSLSSLVLGLWQTPRPPERSFDYTRGV
jgi:fatty acid desaturase